MFMGHGGRVHTRVHQVMRELLSGTGKRPYLDATAQRFVDEGRAAYQRLDLAQRTLLVRGSQAYLFTWLGDAANEAIAGMLGSAGFTACPCGPYLNVSLGIRDPDALIRCLKALSLDDEPDLDLVLVDAKALAREKWDWALPERLLRHSYASLHVDIPEAMAWLKAADYDAMALDAIR